MDKPKAHVVRFPQDYTTDLIDAVYMSRDEAEQAVEGFGGEFSGWEILEVAVYGIDTPSGHSCSRTYEEDADD